MRSYGFFPAILAAAALVAVAPAFAAAETAAAETAAAETYALDPSHTQVQASWNHLGFSNPGAAFSIREGTLVWNTDDPLKSSVVVRIPVKSIDTRVPKLTESLKADYFEAAKFPEITFRSTSAERIGQTNNYRILGDLTMHGITRPVVLDATLNHKGDHPMMKTPAIGFDASTTIKRSEFGIGAQAPFVSDEVKIRITGEAVQPDSLKTFLEQIDYHPNWD